MQLTSFIPFLVCLNAALASKQGLRHQKKEHAQDDSCVRVFNKLDADKDGSLTKSDLAALLSGQGLMKKEIKAHLSDVDKHTTMNLGEFCKNEKKKKATQKKTKEQKKQGSVQGQAPKDLLLTSIQCESAFSMLDTDNTGLVQISDIDEALTSYYPDFYTSSDLVALENRYGSSAYTDYANFQYYVCYGSSYNTPTFRNDADSSEDDDDESSSEDDDDESSSEDDDDESSSEDDDDDESSSEDDDDDWTWSSEDDDDDESSSEDDDDDWTWSSEDDDDDDWTWSSEDDDDDWTWSSEDDDDDFINYDDYIVLYDDDYYYDRVRHPSD